MIGKMWLVGKLGMWENVHSSVTGASLFGSSQTHTFSVAVTELSVFNARRSLS